MIRKLQPKSKERRRLKCKQPKSKPAIEKSSKPAHALKSKVTMEKLSKASTTKPPKLKPAKGKSTKITPPQKAGKENVDEIDQGHAISDLGRTPESRSPPELVVIDKDQARPDPRESRGALTGSP
nr:hypothetical protein [Tanacetum cinerariifolium]GFA40253.1 hypothetical protein [Tanacetum cinerariifolium]